MFEEFEEFEEFEVARITGLGTNFIGDVCIGLGGGEPRTGRGVGTGTAGVGAR